MTDESPFELSIDLAVLDDLGMNLYSNTPAVLSEAVANAYDADADEVEVTINLEDDKIIIKDNGDGMSRGDINSKYLNVGYKRRKDPDAPKKTKKYDRAPMGRKGIGKLSLFSLADTICVETVKAGHKNGCILSASDIRAHIESGAPTPYRPEEIPEKVIDFDKGTRLTLSKIRKNRVNTDRLKVRLARRFSVIGSKEFQVKIDGERVESRDRLGSIPFLYSLCDEKSKELFKSTTDTELFKSPEVPGWKPEWGSVNGWLGVVEKRKDVTKPGENLNNIPILARGRLCVENLLDHLDDGRLVTKYLSGQLVADFLDDDDSDDIVTSNRQQVRENDERFILLTQYVKGLITGLDNERNQRLDKKAEKEITTEFPRIKTWLSGLTSGTRNEAKRMLGRIYRMKDFDDNTAERNKFLRTSIIAFERLRIRDQHKELVDSIDDPQALMAILEDLDGLEASLYLDIVGNRLATIDKIKQLIDEDEIEKKIQEYLFEHLWLFDTSWERAEGSQYIEQEVTTEFESIKDKEKKEIRDGRIDIKYRKETGTHVIIELKRPGRTVTVGEIIDQISKYKKGLEKCLDAVGDKNRHIQTVVMLGDQNFSEEDREDLLKIGITTIYYRQLLSNAHKAYGEFYEKRKERDLISQLFTTNPAPSK